MDLKCIIKNRVNTYWQSDINEKYLTVINPYWVIS